MRILMLSQFYPPIIGGGAIHVRSLSIELVSRGHDVAIVTLWHQGQAEFELDRGCAGISNSLLDAASARGSSTTMDDSTHHHFPIQRLC